MALQQKPGVSGHFVDPDLKGKPGTYAIVIGVSAYPHLEGGDETKAAKHQYELGQLKVSALTAHRFFQWLRAAYRFDAAPLAQAWVLASPTTREMADHPPMKDYAKATFANCTAALREWYGTMAGQTAVPLEQSRAIFFFSGHGIEQVKNKQVLLPSDYLVPPHDAVNDAISVENLTNALRGLPINAEFYFVDACRTLPKEMEKRELVLTGAKILNEVEKGFSRREQPIVSAAPPDTTAWQDEGGDASLFGRALLDGLLLPLEEAKNDGCKHRAPPSHIGLIRVVEHANRRVAEALDDAGKTEDDPVRMSTFAPYCVTEPPVPGRPVDPLILPSDSNKVRLDAKRYENTPPGSQSHRRQKVGVAGKDSFQALHPQFEHETLTMFFSDAMATPLGSGGPGAAMPLVIEAAERYGKSGHRVLFRVQSDEDTWVEFPSDYLKRSFFCRLPGAHGHGQPLFQAELTATDSAPASFAISLSTENRGHLGSAALMWQKLRQIRPSEALDELKASDLEKTLRYKKEAPLAATIAGILLLRAGAHDRLHDWLRNLSDWFEYLPDGAVLWAEHLMQTRRDVKAEPVEVVKHLTRLADRGLPVTADAFQMALEIADELCDRAYHERRGPFGGEMGERSILVHLLRDQLRRAAKHARPWGMFQLYGSELHGLQFDTVVSIRLDEEKDMLVPV